MKEIGSAARGPLLRLDARVRVVCALAASIVLAIATRLDTALAGLVLGAVLLVCAGPCLRDTLRRLCSVNAFMAFLWLTVPWSLKGDVLLSPGSLAITREGVALSLLVTLKCNAIFLFFSALVGTLSLPAFGSALDRLHFPNKLTLLLLFSWRYLSVLRNEWHNLHTAAKLRGFTPATNVRTYRTYANMLGMLLVRSHDRAGRVWEAMTLRCFSGRFPSLITMRATASDLAFAALLFLFLLALVLNEADLLLPAGLQVREQTLSAAATLACPGVPGA